MIVIRADLFAVGTEQDKFRVEWRADLVRLGLDPPRHSFDEVKDKMVGAEPRFQAPRDGARQLANGGSACTGCFSRFNQIGNQQLNRPGGTDRRIENVRELFNSSGGWNRHVARDRFQALGARSNPYSDEFDRLRAAAPAGGGIGRHDARPGNDRQPVNVRLISGEIEIVQAQGVFRPSTRHKAGRQVVSFRVRHVDDNPLPLVAYLDQSMERRAHPPGDQLERDRPGLGNEKIILIDLFNQTNLSTDDHRQIGKPLRRLPGRVFGDLSQVAHVKKSERRSPIGIRHLKSTEARWNIGGNRESRRKFGNGSQRQGHAPAAEPVQYGGHEHFARRAEDFELDPGIMHE